MKPKEQTISKFTKDVVSEVTSKLVETETKLASERELCESLQKDIKTLESEKEAVTATCKVKSQTLKRTRRKNSITGRRQQDLRNISESTKNVKVGQKSQIDCN